MRRGEFDAMLHVAVIDCVPLLCDHVHKNRENNEKDLSNYRNVDENRPGSTVQKVLHSFDIEINNERRGLRQDEIHCCVVTGIYEVSYVRTPMARDIQRGISMQAAGRGQADFTGCTCLACLLRQQK
ncbi:hypothetical protein CBL_11528 [Carabus blaptoides fortunei]